jgi:hypothetical protein
MKQFKKSRNLLILSILVMVLAVACSGATTSDSEATQSDAPQPTSTTAEAAATEEAEEPAESPATEAPAAEATAVPESTEPTEPAEPAEPKEAAASPSGTGSGDESSSESGWDLTQVGEGNKPAVAVDAAGVVHIAYLTEADHGAVFYGNNASGGFEVETISEGYFYGPLDLALGPDGTPYIAYHDHQATSFNPEKGDEVVAVLGEGGWQLETVSSAGHDGWDNSIVVDSAGNWHTAAVDPSQFNRTAGVEYASNAGGSANVAEIGSGAIAYEFGTSIQLDADELPAVAYYDDKVDALAYAKFDGSDWSVEIVDDDGDAGRYASLAFDADGAPHITYFVFDGANSGVVRHAWLDGGAWTSEDVDTLDDVEPGHLGARKITALAFDAGGTAHIAYSDRSRLVYGQQGEDGWSMQEVPHLTDLTLGQLVELAIDGDGQPHLIWFEVESSSPLFGPIVYATPS